jgi:hypothetical protein
MNASEHHPARSADFLSRLHDGDLDAAERARFEAHRAHCAECRDAAAEFEDALAFFRSSRPRPPAPDLAARILRSLRASTPRRVPLGRAFGIDLKWAGAFATALIAVIIGSTVILERERRDARLLRETSIPVSVETRADAPRPAAPKTQPSPGVGASNRLDAGRMAEARRHSDVTAGLAATERKQLPAGRAEADAVTEKRANATSPDRAFAPAPQSAPPPAVAAGAPAPPASAARDAAAKPKVLDKTAENEERAGALRARQRAELQGGDGGQQQQVASSTVTVAQEPAPAIRIQILAPDGQGSAPEPSNAAELSLSPADRGEYVVVVRSDGTVASVREAASTSDARKLDKLKEARRPALDELKKLRFAPVGRPRHLVLKVE